jgi:hypothetical protein
MFRRILAALAILVLIVLVAYTVPLNPRASVSPKELHVISQTRGNESLTAEFLDNQVRIKLKNNHKSTITAFAIRFRDTTIKEDFAYSEVHDGIEPGDTFEKSYPQPPSPISSELPTLHLLTVLLKDGVKDGNSKLAQQIKDERLGEKIQVLRALRILGQEGQSRKEPRIVKGDITAALSTSEFETRTVLKELQPTSRIDDKLSDDFKNGLQWGREKMLQKLDALERMPTEYREKKFLELKDRTLKLLAKL